MAEGARAAGGGGFDVNEAIVLMFGDYPNLDRRGVAAKYGERAAEVVRAVNALMREAMGVEVDWSSHDNSTAGDAVAGVMRERHPELSAAALECVGDYVAFNMR